MSEDKMKENQPKKQDVFEQFLNLSGDGVVTGIGLLLLLALGGVIIAFSDQHTPFNVEKIAIAIKTMLGENYGYYSQSSAGIALCIANIAYLASGNESNWEKWFDNIRTTLLTYLTALFSALIIVGFFGLEDSIKDAFGQPIKEIPLIAWFIFLVAALLHMVCTYLNQEGKTKQGSVLALIFGFVVIQPWRFF